jgi:hypothetical protein
METINNERVKTRMTPAEAVVVIVTLWIIVFAWPGVRDVILSPALFLLRAIV